MCLRILGYVRAILLSVWEKIEKGKKGNKRTPQIGDNMCRYFDVFSQTSDENDVIKAHLEGHKLALLRHSSQS
jgi:hypothetical protein